MILPPDWTGGRLGAGGGSIEPPGPLVLKCGGSLLSRPGWPPHLRRLHRALAAPAPPLLVVGGGAIVDGLRAIDAAGGLDAALVHGVAIELMAATARLVAAELGLEIVSSAAGGGILDAAGCLAACRIGSLPAGWDVTSDSIAAAVATAAGRPLLLVKSVPPPATDLAEVSRLGWVDARFPRAAARLPWIGWVCPAADGGGDQSDGAAD
ncbi:MAG: hypothetical protein ACOYK7_00845 [Pirellulales bacterium]|jgi:hypothetical protein